LSDHLQHLVDGKATAYDAWVAIRNHFEKEDPIAAQTIRNRISKIKFENPRKVAEIMKTLDSEIATLKTKTKISDKEVISIYLAAMTHDYNGIYSSITTSLAQGVNVSLDLTKSLISEQASKIIADSKRS